MVKPIQGGEGGGQVSEESCIAHHSGGTDGGGEEDMETTGADVMGIEVVMQTAETEGLTATVGCISRK